MTTQERIDLLNAEIAEAAKMVRHGDRALETDLEIKVAERDRLISQQAGGRQFRSVVFKNG